MQRNIQLKKEEFLQLLIVCQKTNGNKEQAKFTLDDIIENTPLPPEI